MDNLSTGMGLILKDLKGENRMYIGDLIDNTEFSFNAQIRIIWRKDNNETITVFDSTISGDMSFDLMFKRISAINMGNDGVLEIEYTE